MKKILVLFVLFSSLFANYRITQYYGATGSSATMQRVHSRSWITETSIKAIENFGIGSFFSDIAFTFIDKNTGKKVMITQPYTIEEL